MYDKIKKVFFMFDPETAHKIAEKALILSNCIGMHELLKDDFCLKSDKLKQNLFGLDFANPVGLAGGFDKNATMIKPLASLGFGFLEFGTFTPKAQPGNPKPRLFRLIEEESLQNAMGFNNLGSDFIAKKLNKIYPYELPLIANIGKNKLTPNENAIDDYVFLTQKFSQICDLFLINVSSPNTPNLRNLQDESFIEDLLGKMRKKTQKPILFKIAPDMDENLAIKLCQKAVECGAKGVVINNTSIDYTLSPNAKDFGGLSGKVITQKSRELFIAVAKELYGKCVLISSGGIDNGKEAYERIKWGANLIEIFTSFIFKGPFIAKNINKEILELLQNDGFENLSQAVGVNLKKEKK